MTCNLSVRTKNTKIKTNKKEVAILPRGKIAFRTILPKTARGKIAFRTILLLNVTVHAMSQDIHMCLLFMNAMLCSFLVKYRTY